MLYVLALLAVVLAAFVAIRLFSDNTGIVDISAGRNLNLLALPQLVGAYMSVTWRIEQVSAQIDLKMLEMTATTSLAKKASLLAQVLNLKRTRAFAVTCQTNIDAELAKRPELKTEWPDIYDELVSQGVIVVTKAA